ncbi:MAG: GTP cyclohydrolase II [Chloroflexota bacterium]
MDVTVSDAVSDLQAGKAILLSDDGSRENESDVVIAADFATPDAINFMAREARGLICIAMTGTMLDRFRLPLMAPAGFSRSGRGTNFTVSVEARHGVTTGISAHDRARTVAVLIDPASRPQDISVPGHMFPLRAHQGGVFARPGHTEASVTLMQLAGLTPAAVICEVMAEDGHMAGPLQIRAFARRHGLKAIAVEDLLAFLANEKHAESIDLPQREILPVEKTTLPLAERLESAMLPTRYGLFQVTVYGSQRLPDREHLVLRLGDCTQKPPLVRVHSECVTGDLLRSLRCDCGDQLQAALERIGREGCGLLIYLRQEGRGIGLANKIRAYALQDGGMDTVEANLALGFPADLREYGLAAAILMDQEISEVRLMTNNPHKIQGLSKYGIRIVERIPHQFGLRDENRRYLKSKAEKLNHQLCLSDFC